MSELKSLVSFSKYAGTRFDLVQAGGGNSSVKQADGRMLIKSSGVQLADLAPDYGISAVDYRRIRDFIKEISTQSLSKDELESEAKLFLQGANLNQASRPSIETFLHALTPFKFTLHTHPLLVNVVAARKTWEEEFQSLFPDAHFLRYFTPGIELAIELLGQSSDKGLSEGTPIFLQNHGLIVTADTSEQVIRLTEEVCNKLEQYLSVDFSRYRAITEIQNHLLSEGITSAVHLSDDHTITRIMAAHPEYLHRLPFCPDVLVYCGLKPCMANFLGDLSHFLRGNGCPPKIILYRGHIYILESSLKKARETEEVFRFNLMVLELNNGYIESLSKAELNYLNTWEAEKWRQTLK